MINTFKKRISGIFAVLFILMVAILFQQGSTEYSYADSKSIVTYRNYSSIELDGTDAIGKIAEIYLHYGMVWDGDYIRFWTEDSNVVHLKKSPAFMEKIKLMASEPEQYRVVKFRIRVTGFTIKGDILNIECSGPFIPANND